MELQTNQPLLISFFFFFCSHDLHWRYGFYCCFIKVGPFLGHVQEDSWHLEGMDNIFLPTMYLFSVLAAYDVSKYPLSYFFRSAGGKISFFLFYNYNLSVFN